MPGFWTGHSFPCRKELCLCPQGSVTNVSVPCVSWFCISQGRIAQAGRSFWASLGAPFPLEDLKKQKSFLFAGASAFPDMVPAVILVSVCPLASWTRSSTWPQPQPHWPSQAVAAHSKEQEAAPSSSPLWRALVRSEEEQSPADHLTLSGWQGNLNYTPKGCGLWKTRKNVSIVYVNCFVLQAGVNQHICSPYLSDPLHKSLFERMPLMWGGCLCKTQPPLNSIRALGGKMEIWLWV